MSTINIEPIIDQTNYAIHAVLLTSPMPEDAPVMRTILPRMFSGKQLWKARATMLRIARAGHKHSSTQTPTAGIARFKNACNRSIIYFATDDDHFPTIYIRRRRGSIQL
jgi:hypothetical protein